MYETQTFETIMDRCLSRVSSSVDKREGSVIYDALAPACAELATLYTELSNILDRRSRIPLREKISTASAWSVV